MASTLLTVTPCPLVLIARYDDPEQSTLMRSPCVLNLIDTLLCWAFYDGH